jgi:hypothetical protein
MSNELRADAVAFFHEQAGYSYDPATETPEQGQQRCAEALAAAEAWLMEQAGHTVEWLPDEDEANQWGCIVRIDPRREASLWGIGFADDAEPWGQPYARVVVAELAQELMPD